MSGVKEKLDYLEETKSLLKDSINSLGGTLEDSTPFDEYPNQLPDLIETHVIPQSTVNTLTNTMLNINGVKPLKFGPLKLVPYSMTSSDKECFLGAEVHGLFNTGDIIEFDDNTTLEIGWMRVGLYNQADSRLQKVRKGYTYGKKASESHEYGRDRYPANYVNFELEIKVTSKAKYTRIDTDILGLSGHLAGGGLISSSYSSIINPLVFHYKTNTVGSKWSYELGPDEILNEETFQKAIDDYYKQGILMYDIDLSFTFDTTTT